MIDSTYEDKLYQTPTFAGAVRKLQTNELRNTVMLRLLRVNRLCSRTVSGTANRLRKTRKKKSSAVPLFRSGHMSVICARPSQKEVGVKRVETVGVYPLAPPRGAANSRAPRSAALRLISGKKTTVHNQKPVLYKTQRS